MPIFLLLAQFYNFIIRTEVLRRISSVLQNLVVVVVVVIVVIVVVVVLLLLLLLLLLQALPYLSHLMRDLSYKNSFFKTQTIAYFDPWALHDLLGYYRPSQAYLYQYIGLSI